jgi:hypothetical protein
LEELELDAKRNAFNLSWFVGIFEHTWSTLTNVHIYRCNSVVDFQTAISHAPNLLYLSPWECSFKLDASALTTHVPRLKDLCLGNRLTIDLDSLQHQQCQHKLSALSSQRLAEMA